MVAVILGVSGCSSATPRYDSQFGEALQTAKKAQRIETNYKVKQSDSWIPSREAQAAYDSYLRGPIAAPLMPAGSPAPAVSDGSAR